MTLSRPATALLLAATLLGAAGCAREVSPDVVNASSVGEVNDAFFGTVQSMRPVTIQEGDRLQQNTTGAVIGGLAGAAVGSVFGGGWGRVIATGAGAVVGSVVGAAAERDLSRQQGIEYTVRLDNGRMITIVQGPQPALSTGQRVIVQTSSQGRARVVAS